MFEHTSRGPTAYVSVAEQRKRADNQAKMTRRGFLFSGIGTFAAGIVGAVFNREAIVRNTSYVALDKLAGDLRRHLDSSIFTPRLAPREVVNAQAIDRLNYSPYPPQKVKELTEGKEATERFNLAINDLYYDGVINLNGANDDMAEKEITELIKNTSPQLCDQTRTLALNDNDIDSLIPCRQIRGAVVDDKHAAHEIIEFLESQSSTDQPALITMNQPPYHEEKIAETDNTLAFDKQHEAALKRRKAKNSTDPLTIPFATPIATAAAGSLIGAGRSSSGHSYDHYYTTDPKTQKKQLTRRGFLKFFGLGAGSLAVTAATASAIDTTLPLGAIFKTGLVDVDEKAVWKTINERMPKLMQRPLHIGHNSQNVWCF